MSNVTPFPGVSRDTCSLGELQAAFNDLLAAHGPLRAGRVRVARATDRVSREDSTAAHQEMSTARTALMEAEETHRRALARYVTASGVQLNATT